MATLGKVTKASAANTVQLKQAGTDEGHLLLLRSAKQSCDLQAAYSLMTNGVGATFQDVNKLFWNG